MSDEPREDGAGPTEGLPPGGPPAAEAAWEAPWADAPGWTEERRLLAMSFALAVRKTGSLMNLMSQAAADRVGINATDLGCLNILSFSGSMTAGELARATGLTTASITGVVDRLEAAGFVSRQRDPADRRRVVVTIAMDKAVSEVSTLFAPMVVEWQELVAGYSDDQLRLIVEFYGQMEQVIRKHLARLREQPPPQPA
jgi:DNA-binding MarR family transcriptional regulator